MHRALATLDILSHIFECVHEFEDHYKILLICASVNKLWAAAAHRWVWRTLPHLLPLFKLLPKDAVEVSRNSIVLARTLKPEDWDRFKEYAHLVRRVRHLDSPAQHYKGCPYVDGAFLSAIAAHFPLESPFPRLTHITWTTGSKQVALGLIPFISPALTHLHFHAKLGLTMEAFDSVLASVGSNTSDKFEYLQIGVRSSPETVVSIDALQDLLTKRPSLKGLEVNFRSPVPTLAIPTILQLPRLEVLHICLADAQAFADIQVPPNLQEQLPALQTLIVTGPPELTSQFLGYSSNPSVQPKLRIQPHGACMVHSIAEQGDHPGSTVLKQVFDALAGFPNSKKETIAKIDVLVNHHGSYVVSAGLPAELFPQEASLPKEFMLNFQHFSNLITLRIDVGLPHKIDDEGIDILARSLPKLQNLNFGPEPFYMDEDFQPLVTLRGLLSLGKNCKHLDCCSLLFDARKGFDAYEEEMKKKPPFTSKCKLLSLNTGRSPIDGRSEDDVGLFLSDVFPNLHYLDFVKMYAEDEEDDEDDEDEEEGDDLEGVTQQAGTENDNGHAQPVRRGRDPQVGYTTSWGHVNTLLPVLRRARAQERQKLGRT